MTKKKTPPAAVKKDPRTVELTCTDEAERPALLARAHLQPSLQAAHSLMVANGHSDPMTIMDVIGELNAQAKAVQDGNLSRPESMLSAQAHTLDALFNNLLRHSLANIGEYRDAAETYMKLALKAQSQCRTTLEAIGEIKNPRPYIQNNRAHYQQVNNGQVSSDNPRVEKTKATNELLEDKSHEQQRMDIETSTKTSPADTELETMEAQYWAKDGCGQKQG